METPSSPSTVAQYMQSDVVWVHHHATIREAMKIFVEQKINSVVVVDDDHRVVGMLSSIDVIQYIVPDYLEEDRHLASFEAGDVFARRVREVADQPVTRSMSKDIKTIQPNHTLIAAVTLLSEHRINQLPVVDETGKLIGYIGRSNIKQAIHDALS